MRDWELLEMNGKVDDVDTWSDYVEQNLLDFLEELDAEDTVVDSKEGEEMRRRFMTSERRCVCGAAKTSNPNLHADYCDLYTDPMGGK